MSRTTADGRILDEIVVVDGDGDELPVEPSLITGEKGLRVFIDPLDEMYQELNYRASIPIDIGSTTVKFGIQVAQPPVVQMLVNVKMAILAYNGASKLTFFESSTFTGGVVVPFLNKNRNLATMANTVLKQGVASTNGTPLSTIYAGAGGKSSAKSETANWLLKFGSLYRVDVEGLAAGSIVVVTFDLYEG